MVAAQAGAPAGEAGGVFYVRPGDVVVVGPPGTTPAPEEQRGQLVASARAAVTRLMSTTEREAGLVVRTVSHLPVGLAQVLFAPFPWSSRRLLDVPAIAETVVWSIVVAAAAISAFRLRRRWRLIAASQLFTLGLLGLLALAEGNTGTLFRHRGMAIPLVLLLAAPAFNLALRRVSMFAARLDPQVSAVRAGGSPSVKGSVAAQ